MALVFCGKHTTDASWNFMMKYLASAKLKKKGKLI